MTVEYTMLVVVVVNESFKPLCGCGRLVSLLDGVGKV